jgi:pimeloyl-ACP methyl ester carboxylesterase
MTIVPAQAHTTAAVAELEGLAHKHNVAARHGGRVTWRRFGDGPPLVLLHGGHGNWLHWVRNIRALAAHHTLWLPDMPGYGDSDLPAQPTLASLVDALGQTLETLVGSLAHVHLAGFSFGGLVAASLAQRHAVASLALFGPAGHGGVRRPRAALRSWRGLDKPKDAATLADVMRHNLWAHMLYDSRNVDATALQIHTAACRRTRFHSKQISRAGGLGAELASYDGPLLLVWGEHDVTADPVQAAQALAQGRRDCSIHILTGIGHWAPYEAADESNLLLRQWLQSPDSQRTLNKEF